MTDLVIYWLLVSVVHKMNLFLIKVTCQIILSGQPHMLQILCSSVRVKLLARAKFIFLREQPDDFFSVGNPASFETENWVSNYIFQMNE